MPKPSDRSQTRARTFPAVAAAGVLTFAIASGLHAVRGGGDGPPDAAVTSEPEPAVIRDGFETTRPAWNQEQTDATIELRAHDRSNRAAHEGRSSEHFQFSAGVGSGFYFGYPLPKVRVTDALKASLYVRANRAGVQLFARVVLPADTDPETKQPSFLQVPGAIYDNVDRWQRLEVLDLRPSLERQARVLRASTRRKVSLEGAYVEQLVVNLYAGAGETEVFLDELAVGPVAAAVAAAHANGGREAAAGGPEPPGVLPDAPETAKPGAAKQPPVRVDRNRLKRRGDDGLFHDWFFTAIDAPGADVASLRSSGFDVLIDDVDADPKRLQEAVRRGFLLIPRFGEATASDPDRVLAAARAFPYKEAVMAWGLGDHLGLTTDLGARKEQLDATRAAVSKLRGLPAGISLLTTGVVEDDLPLYARVPQNLQLLGVRSSAWASSVSLLNNVTFLRQRRDLAARGNPGAFFWAELPASAPPDVPRAVWGVGAPPAWGSSMIQPEQLRLMTYAALAAGYRGLAFRGDAELTRGTGRMLLLEMAMLNAEVDLCESILANGEDPIPTYYAFANDPSNIPPPGSSARTKVKKEKEQGPLGEIRAAAIGTRDRKGVLLVVADQAYSAQYQPPQMARNDVNLTVIVPEGAQAFEISPGRVKVVESRERYIGGTRYKLPEFDTTALLLITTDVAMAQRVEAVVNAIAPRAAQMAIEQAELKLQWVTEINDRLVAEGHYLIQEKERKKREVNGGPLSTDQADLLRKAAENIKAARENAERLDWGNAWAEARRASRPLRLLMRGLWDNAYEAMLRANTPAEVLAMEEQINLGRVKRPGPPMILPPVASAPLVAFNTMPQHYVWVDAMKEGTFGRNLIPSGSFDDPDTITNSGWSNVSYPYAGITGKVLSVPEDEKDEDGPRMIRLLVLPDRPVDTLSPYLDQPAAAVRSPAVKVKAGQFLRVSVFIKRPLGMPAGAGGVIVRDSIGGEALQYVGNDPIPVKSRLILYRRAPADGEFTVTLGLAGYGDVYFDGLSVERVEAAPPADVAGRSPARHPDPVPPAAARAAGARPAARAR